VSASETEILLVSEDLRHLVESAEERGSLLQSEALAPLYVRCLAEGGQAWNGRIVEAQDWLATGA